MPVAKITGQGLSAIALSVALLWGFLIVERNVSRRAYAGRMQALEQIRRLRQRTPRQPVSAPIPQVNPHSRPALG